MGHVFGVGDKVLFSTKHFTPPAYQGRKRELEVRRNVRSRASRVACCSEVVAAIGYNGASVVPYADVVSLRY
jgi:hypothetical protein